MPDRIRYNQLVQYINAALYGGIAWTGPTYTYGGQDRLMQAVTTNLDDAVQVRAQYTYYPDAPPPPDPAPPGAGLCATAMLSYSDDAGSTWYTIGTRSYTYTVDGQMAAPTWTYA